MRIVTKGQAQMLIAREFGIKNMQLQNMGRSSDEPCFVGMVGNIKIKVEDYLNLNAWSYEKGIIELHAYFTRSGHSVRLFFFTDTLEFADDVTAYEKLGDVSDGARERARQYAIQEIINHLRLKTANVK
ncbi:MAG: hypothetical protein GXZ14_00980 [Ruminococcaceae bacterium]|nr:hypothetical protein [Oscillospiraceae bacterium]